MSFHEILTITIVGVVISALTGFVGWVMRSYLTRIEKLASSNSTDIRKVRNRLSLFILAATEVDPKISAKWQEIRERIGFNPTDDLELFEAEVKEGRP